MATQRVSFCKFIPNGSYDLDLIVSRLFGNCDDSNRLIFNEQGKQYLSGCYLVQQARNEMTYNVQENKFETIVTSRLIVVKFEIDIPKSVLTIWGNKNIAQKFITLLSQACDNKAVIDSYQVDFKSMLERISILENAILSKMKLENVLIDSGITASCSVSLVNLDNARELVTKYSENISQLSLIIGDRFEENSVALTLFSSGSMVIYKDRDSVSDEIIDEIQKIAIG